MNRLDLDPQCPSVQGCLKGVDQSWFWLVSLTQVICCVKAMLVKWRLTFVRLEDYNFLRDFQSKHPVWKEKTRLLFFDL